MSAIESESACYLNFESSHGTIHTNSVENDDSATIDINNIQKYIFNIIYAHPESPFPIDQIHLNHLSSKSENLGLLAALVALLV